MLCVHLALTEAPLEIVIPLQDQEILERQTATFVCEVSKPNQKAKWLKDDKEIKTGGRYEIRVDGTNHILIIKDAEKSEQAKYTVAFAEVSSAASLTLSGFYIFSYFYILN